MTFRKRPIMETKTRNILVVDDEAKNHKLYKAILRSQEYNCAFAKNAEEAFDALKSFRPDVMIVDVMMPIMDGFEFTRKLKSDEATRQIPIILATALSDRDTRLQGIEAGAEEFINKPFVKEELMMRLRNLFRLKEYSDLLENQKK